MTSTIWTPPPVTSSCLETSLWALEVGLWPIPVYGIGDKRARKPDGKQPLGGKGWGLKRPDESFLRATYERERKAGGGLKLGPEGEVVDLDVDDPEAAGPTLARLFPEGIPKTLGWKNLEGKYHLLFRWDDRLAAYAKAVIKGPPNYPGLELRIGCGKQTQSVIPPSLLPNGAGRRWNEHAEILPLPESVFGDLEKYGANEATIEKPLEAVWDDPGPTTVHKNGTSVKDLGLAFLDPGERAARYLGTMAPAIEGEDGSGRCFRAAAKMVEFGLGYDTALRLLMKLYNPTCKPEWSEKEMRHKLDDAFKKAEPGKMLDADRNGDGRANGDGAHLKGAARTKAKPSANGNGNGSAHVTVEAGDEKPKVHELPDDPHRLVRVFLDGRHRSPGGLLLRYYQGEYHRWSGAYRPTPEKDIRAQLTATIKGEFNRLNVEEITAWEERGKVDARGKECAKPPVRKVTSGLTNNAAGALAGETLLHHLTGQPAWLIDDEPFPADEALPTRNALIHLPGLVDGSPGAIIPPTPHFFGGYCLDYDFDAEAPEPVNWLTFLGTRPITEHSKVRLQLWPDDPQCIEALQEWMGLHLLPDTSQQKIGMLIGPRRCGKGTISRILRRMIGAENVANPTLAGLASHFGLNPLINKPCAIISDARLSGKTDVAAVVERLLSISGEDAQTIDRKHLAAWTGLLPTRFTIVSNELPRLSDTSGALAGRMIIFPLKNSFYGKEDPKLTGLLMQELPGILLWAIEGWRRLRERGYFVQPDSAREMVEELEELSSPVGMFLKDRCLVEPGREIMAKKLFDAWKEWCTEKGRDHPGDEQGFGRNLRTVMPNLKTPSRRLQDGTRKRFYEGIDLQWVPGNPSGEAY